MSARADSLKPLLVALAFAPLILMGASCGKASTGAITTAGASVDGSSTGQAGDATSALSKLGGCEADEVLAAPLDQILTLDGTWYEVLGLENVTTKASDVATFLPVNTTYRSISEDGASVGTKSDGELILHSSEVPEIQTALSLGARVYVLDVMKSPEDLEQSLANFKPDHSVQMVLAINGSDFAFLGDCMGKVITEPMFRLLGADAANVAQRLPGASSTQRAQIVAEASYKSFQATSTTTTTDGPVQEPLGGDLPPQIVLNPVGSGAQSLPKLLSGSFRITNLPDGWKGPYTLCTAGPAGWSDCIDLTSAALIGAPVRTYVDPGQPVVEVWILDRNADTKNPLAQIARVTVDPGTGEGFNVSVTFADNGRIGDVLGKRIESGQTGSLAPVRVDVSKPG